MKRWQRWPSMRILCVQILNQPGFRLHLRNNFKETPQILAVWAVLLPYKGREWSNTKVHHSLFVCPDSFRGAGNCYNKFWKDSDHEPPQVEQKQGHKCPIYMSHLRQTLEQTETNGSWATSHFQASLLGVCTHLSPSLQITQHQFHQFLRPLKTVGLQLITGFLMCLSRAKNLSFRSWYEDWRPHLQRQISELPLLYHILHRHSRTIKKTWSGQKIYLETRMWRWRYKTLYLDRRLVQSCHICPVLSCPRSCDNLLCSTLSICGNA